MDEQSVREAPVHAGRQEIAARSGWQSHQEMRETSDSDVFFEDLLHVVLTERFVSDNASICASLAASAEVRQHWYEICELSASHHARFHAIFDRHRIETGFADCKAIKGLFRGGRADLIYTESSHIKDFRLVAFGERLVSHTLALCGTTAKLASRFGFSEEANFIRTAMDEKIAYLDRLGKVGDSCLWTGTGDFTL
ncbi:DUF892 family protein [Luteolibacter sp. GHJ8]|uniref:DUF892 family protein n=1 Tax=Luteolibacter rhizosphaerae TaxID=2989719 RepID=A0ABT3G142_9BACT|nr:DUF892 family protein [Luteolibacter rhizosphaerae]MCW1912950.1 DUF892 family protein [Luteolibacter rhizosphaerae]